MTYQEYRVTFMSSNNEWKLPLNLAIGFHILVALSTILFPMVFKSKPEFVDIYSVNLVNMEESAAPAAPAPAPTPAKTQSQPPPASPPKVIEKTATPIKIPPKEAVPVAAEKPPETAPPAEVAPPAPPKAVSLTPIKRKVKKEVPPDDTVQREAEKREREIERQRRQQLAESLRAEQIAAEEAQLAAEAAEAERNRMEQTRQRLSQIRSSIQGSASSTTSNTSNNSSTTATQGGGSTSALEDQYYGKVAAKIQPYFQLPEIKTFDPALVTKVIITISKSGEVVDTQIESSSGDALYDQFVLKSIAAANPLPSIPPAIGKQRIEMGLNFNPGGIQ